MNTNIFKIIAIPVLTVFCSRSGFSQPYLWKVSNESQSLSKRIFPPKGYSRISISAGSYAAWLRNLPIRAGHPPVRLFNGQLKANQEAHYAVVDIDVGKENLQQCADAIIRLRAEYLFASGHQENICFRFTSGDKAAWVHWRDGYRPLIAGKVVKWMKRAQEDPSYSNFRSYLKEVNRWAGTASLSKELLPVDEPVNVEIGDVFIKGGAPGHAVLVVDVAQDSSGRRAFLLAQSYMPAQDIHILKNPISDLGPWYSAEDPGKLITPEWIFSRDSLRRFSDDGCPSFR